jgi:hypothetical protein
MRRFLWIRTKGGKGGNTRRVHNALVAEEPLFGGNMRRMGGNTRRGRMCGICRRLRVPGNLWRACVESVGDALFGGNMRRFLWICTKGGKGGNTRRVHNVLVAEEPLFGGNMRRNGGHMRRLLWIRTKGGKGGKGGGNTRGAPHRTAFRLHVSDTAFNALVAEEALFGGNMRGVGGNTRRVHNVLVAEEALFGGNMRGVRSRSIIFDAC